MKERKKFKIHHVVMIKLVHLMMLRVIIKMEIFGRDVLVNIHVRVKVSRVDKTVMNDSVNIN